MGKAPFEAHTKYKDSFYVKRATTQETYDVWEQARIRRDKQRKVRKDEYWDRYFANRAFAHQEQVASLYESSIPEVKTQNMANMESLSEVLG